MERTGVYDSDDEETIGTVTKVNGRIRVRFRIKFSTQDTETELKLNCADIKLQDTEIEQMVIIENRDWHFEKYCEKYCDNKELQEMLRSQNYDVKELSR